MTAIQITEMENCAVKRRRKIAADRRRRIAHARAAGPEDKKLFAELDAHAVTNWLCGEKQEPSGYVNGAMLKNRDWLSLEKAALAKKGVAVFIAENPINKGEFALVRSPPAADDMPLQTTKQAGGTQQPFDAAKMTVLPASAGGQP